MQNLIATTFEVVHYIALQAVHYKPLQEVHLSRYNQSIALRVGVHPTLSARRATVMAVAKHHNLLAEDAAGRVVRADPGVEE